MRKQSKVILALLLLFLFFEAKGTTYYISNGGSDSANGLTTSTPWASISKINGRTFSAGDNILFQRGDLWREKLVIPSSGTSSNPIVFGAYGAGAQPKIFASTEILNWTNDSGNIWMSNNTVSDPTFGASHDGQSQGTSGNWPGGIWFCENDNSVSWGHQQKYWPLSNLTQEYDWVWDAGYIFVYSSTDPTDRYKSIEVAQRQSGISINSKEHIIIRSLSIRYACSSGVNEKFPQQNLDGVSIEDCTISYIGIKSGASAMGITMHHSNSTISNNTIHDCGRRAVNLLVVTNGLTIENNIIDNNIIYDCFHTGIDMILNATSTIRNIDISNNKLHTSPEELLIAPESYPMTHIFLSDQSSNGTYESIRVFGNTITNPSDKGIQSQDIVDLEIFNNTFYGINPNQNFSGAHIWLERGNTTVQNNICHGTVVRSFNNNWQNLFVTNPDPSTIINRNQYYQEDNTAHFAQINGTFYFLSQWTNYKSTTGYDNNSPTPQNPFFVSSTDYHLQSSSPCIDQGINVGLPFSGLSPDLGAYEFNAFCALNITEFDSQYFDNGTNSNSMDDYYTITILVESVGGNQLCTYEALVDGIVTQSNLSCNTMETFNVPTLGLSPILSFKSNPVLTCDLTRTFHHTLPTK